MDSWNDFNCASLTTEPKSTSNVSSTLCYYNGVYYNDGEIVYSGEGSGDCESLYCSEGVLVPYREGDCGSTPLLHEPQTNPETNAIFEKLTISDTITYLPSSGTDEPVKTTDTTGTRTRKTNIPSETNNPNTNTNNQPTSTKTGTPVVLSSKPLSSLAKTQTTPGPKLCLHNGTFYEEGDIISENFNGDNWCSGLICKDGQLISLNCGNITDIISNEDTSDSKLIIPPTTRGPEPPLCFHEGRFYEESDLAKTGNDWCSGLICKDGAMVIWDDCEAKVESTDQPNAKQTTTPVFRFNLTTESRDTTNIPDITLSQPTIETKSITKAPEAKLCFHNETYYEEGDIISEDFDSDNWCSGWICKDGRLISVNCSDISDIISKGDPSSPKLVVPLTTGGPEPTLCFHEGRFYEEDDLATTGNDWCSGLICKDGAMVIWDNCEVKVENTGIPITKQTTTRSSTSNPTTQSRDVTKTPNITLSRHTNTIAETNNVTKPAKAEMCFHEGKYYEEGDIISQNFDSDNWCSGWICQDGRLISVNCSDVPEKISKDSPSSPKPVLSGITQDPEPSRCFYEERYYEEGDLATTGDNLCSGLVCKDGEMIVWENCEVKPEGTKPSQVTRTPNTNIIPHSTLKPPTRTSTIPNTARSSDKTTDIPDTTTKISDSTIISSDSTTRTTDMPTKPQQTTPTQPPQTTKPEKLRCYYEEALHPPGEVTRGTLTDGRCYGVICDISGVLIQWVSATCEPTEPPTTEIRNTLPGCVYNDKYYPPGRISRVSDGTGWCLDVSCTDEGEIVTINNLQCDKSTTTEPPSTVATAATKTREIKCLYNGICLKLFFIFASERTQNI